MYSRCIHCGLCLNHCPTYKVLGLEADSPRGRIYQVLQVDSGRLEIGESFVTHMDRCLGCRACETACPSGVRYGEILERARHEIAGNYRRPWLSRKLRRFFFLRVLHNRKMLARWARRIRWYQKSGLQSLARGSGVLKLLGLDKIEALAPRMDEDFFLNEIGRCYAAEGECRGRVLLLAGCVASVAFSDLNRATVRLLTRNGIEVFIPEHQRCCGALQIHAGYRHEARYLARKNIRAMQGAEFDAVITNAAGCGAMLKSYGELLHDDEEFGGTAAGLAARSKDVLEYLAAIGLRPPDRRLNARVTYQDPCHLAHGQGIRSAPRELLRQAGAELVETAHPDACCGSAGVYNVVENELSMQVLAAKMDELEPAKADIIASANVGCMLQLRAGVAQRKMKTRVAHVVELLNECYVDSSHPHRRRHHSPASDSR